ncbi:hypothetical protein DFJ74DRAFT_631929 [Hyaloraphidium curvatum]|nr:hypothetical protein DFJ74DRAFT_631929 [Hyaloraphidium curvatum]
MRSAPRTMRFATALAAVAALALAHTADAHISMSSPIPRGSPLGPWPESQRDYSLMSPLDNGGVGRTYPCQGKPKGVNTAKWTAGQQVTVTWSGTATHGGGHCQLAVSYDAGSTFVVLDTILGDCLIRGMSHTFTLPADLPASPSAVFAWTWVNAIGNREYYMNCADVEIVSPTCGPFTAPRLFVAQVVPPSTQVFPEWSATGYDYRNELLNGRPMTTVTGDGCGAPPPPASSQTPASTARPATSTVRPPAATTTRAANPVTTALARTSTRRTQTFTAATPAPQPTGGPLPPCTLANNGQQACPAPPGQGYLWCVNGAWIERPCPAGTKCRALSATDVVCDWV